MSVAYNVRKIIAAQFKIGIDEVFVEADFEYDLGADSLDITELIMTFEYKFGLEIADEEARKLTTVEDTINFIEERIISE